MPSTIKCPFSPSGSNSHSLSSSLSFGVTKLFYLLAIRNDTFDAQVYSPVSQRLGGFFEFKLLSTAGIP